jgi:hypothetical protein
MGSAAMDRNGDIGLGFSVSSGSIHPGIHYTGRLAGDTLGLMTQGEGVLIDGAGSQTGFNLNRWGDYSSMAIDPSDDCTFWYTGEYEAANGAFNWHTRIGSFKLPGCDTSATSDFSIGASPSSLTVGQGSSGTSTISTAVTGGSVQTVSLSASGLPPGTSAGFSPASVTAGGTSTMSVAVGAATAAGTYSITVTGTGTTATRTTTASLTVTAAGPSLVTNGGFETGDLNGWGTSGAFAPVISTSAHAGSYSVQLGSTSAVNGDSTLNQTVAIPSGSSSSQLSFWYQPHCPDAISFDQIQMQIRNTSGATLATVMNVCSNSGAWTNVTYDTSAFTGQTIVLWFNDHDDGYPFDPTYFLLDDVTLTAFTAATSDFSLGASPSSLTVAQGSSGTSTVSTAVTAGSAQTVSLSASGLPAGTSVGFSPASVTAGGSSTMSVAVGAGTAAGTYSITVTATGTTATHTTTVSLTVTAAATSDFSLGASPSSLTVVGSNSTAYAVTITPQGGFTSAVSLSVSGLPNRTTGSFSPNPATSTSTLTVGTARNTRTGTFTLTITGTGGGVTRTTTVTLVVTN